VMRVRFGREPGQAQPRERRQPTEGLSAWCHDVLRRVMIQESRGTDLNSSSPPSSNLTFQIVERRLPPVETLP